MARFNYEALNKGGRSVRGVVEANSEDLVIERLRGMGYYPTLVARAPMKSATSVDLFALPGIRLVMHRVKRVHIVTFTRQLATLLGAGLPILRSLNILLEQTESVVFRGKIQTIVRDVEAGASLSEALSHHPRVFDELYVNMVRAGEIGGALESVLMRIAHFLEKRHALVGKVRSALMYPIVVIVLSSIIIGFIMWKIVPRFIDIYAQIGMEIPGLTRVLFGISNILLTKAWIVALLGISLFIIYRKLNATRPGRFFFDRMKLKIPVFGPVLRKAAIARFSGTLATMVTSGVPILQALDIVRATSGNEVVARAADRVYDQVKDGESLHVPLAESGVFPPMVVHMVAVGEETGAIDAMLEKVAEAYEREVDDTVAGLTSILEPMLVVCLGVVIGFVVVALYLPLFTIGGGIK